MMQQDRRQHPRHASKASLRVSTLDASGRNISFQCRCRDISGGGLSFELERAAMEIGQRVNIAILSAGPATPVDLGRATVVWVQDDAEQPWAGVMLDSLMDESRLQQLLQSTSTQ